MTDNMIPSESDRRVENNVMRHEYRLLQDWEKANMLKIKNDGEALLKFIQSLGSGRELSLAVTNLEQAVMWSVKWITK